MVSLRWTFLYALFVAVVYASPVQVPLLDVAPEGESGDTDPGITKKKPLHGRFLHITDFHPDRFYEIYASTKDDDACHRGQGPAGIYGAETSDCDSPLELINKTMKWIGDELKDKIDFVIWTGDSARHDNDEEHPRNEKQVVGLNQFMVDKMVETFGKHNGDEEDNDPNNDFVLPIVPNLGNNDILPHNIFRQGPNKWTRTYGKLWKQFIPEEQKHQFEQGGWFYVEVIPRKLAVFSLNTMFFFTSNAAADGCASHSEPGYRQMEWLRIQLQFMRERGMKAILTGHVPPAREDTKTSWDETCWQKYTLWLRQYRDVVVSSHYGHFNYDHFILQDFKDLRKGTKKGKMPNYAIETVEEDDIHAKVNSNYFVDLRKAWSKLPSPPKALSWFEELDAEVEELRESQLSLSQASRMLTNFVKSKKRKQKEAEKKYLKKMGGEFAERFSAAFVSASIVPNLYPSLRVYEYNITGLHQSDESLAFPVSAETSPFQEDDFGPDEDVSIAKKSEKSNKSKKSKKRKYKFEIPEAPSKSSAPGPAYSPQTLSLLRYKQYFANLTHINNDFLGLTAESEETDSDTVDAAKWKEGKHKGKTKPKDHEPNPKKFKFELHYDTKHDDVYKLEDLTMPNLVDLARRIGSFESGEAMSMEDDDDDAGALKKKKKKYKKHKDKHRKEDEAWFTFVRRAFLETLSREELEEEFG
ncbi:Endopolyphosphatase [Extremus antarcticus]|uniref:Endopolyphosphatase n=1 Tax=Extremus antarcticus TaxID=702011 RepID=A0AAJ0LUN5_9PEZI|nr:Endopolyphosphatase [Extremus antarcticus]